MFSTQMIIALAVFAIVWFFVIRNAARWSKKNIRGGKTELPTIPNWGAPWQDHMMGTTKLEPGDITEIERDLKTAGKHSEDN